jgi:hypothetical protein
MQLCQMDKWKAAPCCNNLLPLWRSKLLQNVQKMQAGHQGLFLGFDGLRKLDGEAYVSRQRRAGRALLRSGCPFTSTAPLPTVGGTVCGMLADQHCWLGSLAPLQELYVDRGITEDNYLPIRPSPALATMANSLWDLGNRFV